MLSANRYDVIVIGIGSMGSAACCHLAERGFKVLGLEKFNIVHEWGSHTGQTRIIRKAYFEHADYVPLLERAYYNWKELEQKTQSPVYHQTGIVYFGSPDHPTMRGVKDSASLHGLTVEVVSPADLQKRFPAFNIPSDFETLFEQQAGFITPNSAIHCYTELAKRNGAKINVNENVITWKQEHGRINVTTNKGAYTCDKLVITAGSWTSKLVPYLPANLKVTRQVLAWVKPSEKDIFSLGNFPCFFIEDPTKGMFYGFPVVPVGEFGEPFGLKIASHRPGRLADPDNVDRITKQDEEEELRFILSKYIPSAGTNITTTKTCLYTYSDDEHFIIDHLPGYDKQVTIACGFSGHGFKFASVVGEILADLSTKTKTDLPIDFFRLSRFRS